ncbi:hypothetical protein GCM10028819_19620 [Spirosoma humi]
MGDYKGDIDKITSKEDFTRFVGHLLKDLQANPSTWENNTLESYLNGIKSWT